ncbi:hypothetical protein CERSUDRAFT_111336 [Gelatoporia subvermispora B]|uniref:Peptidase S8/S53 domain-containing protein n=1 Tax=Ceriporiopsis subvermispora (strain B) TaxID=914234 RepID=M2QUL0_CERS8|nr:hypothetical protein CERSUDRAFT_111336 [Gelatoporia subvermispora B]
MATSENLVEIERCDGDKVESGYIVLLKDGVDKVAHHAWLRQRLGQNSSVTHDYSPDFINGYTGKFDEDTLTVLRASPDVKTICEDAIVRPEAQQLNAPWGLNRISQAAPLTGRDPFAQDFVYTYDNKAGSGIDIYVVDTGVLINHREFSGRARWGWSAPGLSNTDDSSTGHGTAVASVAAGFSCGVAKAASVISVKVFAADSTSTNGIIIQALEWIVANISAGRPSVVNMSLSSGASTALDEAVRRTTEFGIHVAVAAGNQTADAATRSPARSPYCTTVGGTTIMDARRFDSNWGAVVDVFAPGDNIRCANNANPTAMTFLPGTSLATPHVTGIIACFIASDGNKSPADMKQFIKNIAVRDVLSNLPAGTPNLLANNGNK